MKVTLLVPLVVAGCVALLTVAQLSAQRPPAPQNGTALVDMSAVMKNSNRFIQAMEQLKTQYEAKAAKLKEEADRGNQLAEEVRAMDSADPRRKQLEDKLLHDRADYELEGKKLTNEVGEAESKIVWGLVGDLKVELERFARANGVQLILRNDPAPPELTDPRMILQEIHKPIVYQADSDVTPAILDALNRGTAPAQRTGRTPTQPAR